MTFKHTDKSPSESPTSQEPEDEELQKFQAEIDRFLASGKKIVETHCDPPSPFYVDPKTGKVSRLKRHNQ